ncbi:MAG: exonuclease SbcCD subunit D [Clostridiales bacterium]|nr:exonuclease SbcCD subunit D [Candidatus Blautia equi]
MRFIHISDLHLGKNIYGVSMIENGDQTDWVEQFIKTAGETAPDAVVIAGDVYDRSSPSGEAVLLLDHLLTGLSELGIPVLMVAGNHDSGQRLSFGKNLLSQNQIYISGTLDKKLTSVRIASKDGKDNTVFWLMPYLFPALVSQVLEDETIHDYDTAVRRLLAAQEIDFSEKNILIAHQNVTANGVEAERGGSETMVGGVGQIDYTAFDGFTYAALGHIHSAYPVGRPEVRYAGSPLYYHFDELRQPAKGPLLVEVGEDGAVTSTLLHIPPLHKMREIKDTYANIKENLEQNEIREEYLRVVVTDQKITPEISGFLRDICESRDSILMELISEYQEFTSVGHGVTREEAEEASLEELFTRFFKERRGGEAPDEKEQAILRTAEEILQDHKGADSREPQEKAVDRLLKFILGQEE